MAKVKRNCKQCGEAFETHVWPSTDGKIFCSRKCYADYTRALGRARPCAVCGAPLSGRQKRFCSHRCKGLAIRKQGLHSDGYDYSFNDEFKALIRGRDNDTCAICGSACEPFPAEAYHTDRQPSCIHHINAQKEDTDPRNCILLCAKCHGMVHYHMAYWEPMLYALVTQRRVAAAD